jgi:hypothetical protein
MIWVLLRILRGVAQQAKKADNIVARDKHDKGPAQQPLAGKPKSFEPFSFNSQMRPSRSSVKEPDRRNFV